MTQYITIIIFKYHLSIISHSKRPWALQFPEIKATTASFSESIKWPFRTLTLYDLITIYLIARLIIFIIITLIMVRYGRRHRSHAPQPRNCSRTLSSRTVYETFNDIMANAKIPAVLINGVYTATGNQPHIKAQLDASSHVIPSAQPQMNVAAMNLTQQGIMPNPSMMFPPAPGMYPPLPSPAYQEQEMMLRDNLLQPQPFPPMPLQNSMTVGYGGGINQAKISIHGAKTRPPNNFCYCLTYFLGSILIFPLLFVCCMWWKKIVYPSYELTADVYHAVARFIAITPSMTTLDLTVTDNSFNAQKAAILHEALSRSQIQSFLFTNKVLNCDTKDNEASNFRQNMASIKALSMKTSIVWADMEF